MAAPHWLHIKCDKAYESTVGKREYYSFLVLTTKDACSENLPAISTSVCVDLFFVFFCLKIFTYLVISEFEQNSVNG